MTTTAFERLVDAAKQAGWSYEEPYTPPAGDGCFETNQAALLLGGSRYPTLITPDGVKIGITSTHLYMRPDRSGVYMCEPTEAERKRNVTIGGIVVPIDQRRKGLGTKAMTALVAMADSQGIRLTLEPQPIKAYHKRGANKAITRTRLIMWYTGLGFAPRTRGQFSVLDREPKAAKQAAA